MAVEMKEQNAVAAEQASPKPLQRGLVNKGTALEYAKLFGVIASKESIDQLRINHKTGYMGIENEEDRNKQVLHDTLLVGFLSMLRRPVRQEILSGESIIDGKKGAVSSNLNGK